MHSMMPPGHFDGFNLYPKYVYTDNGAGFVVKSDFIFSFERFFIAFSFNLLEKIFIQNFDDIKLLNEYCFG